jgi:hypothetical protein
MLNRSGSRVMVVGRQVIRSVATLKRAPLAEMFPRPHNSL